MKKILFSFLIVMFSVQIFAQKDQAAKALLDKTYTAFRQTSGIKANFSVVSYKGIKPVGASAGYIMLKGTKFMMKTVQNTIWFDGKTQWNYIYKNKEVNVSNPSTSELQNLNPYFILSVYQRGFNYKMGSASKYKGKSIKEIILTPQNTTQSITGITIYLSLNDEPVSIILNRKDGTRNQLNISGYKTKQNFKDSMFTYNKKKYPKVEVVDLR